MTPDQNRAIVTAIWTRMARGDTVALSEAMTDDFTWIFPGRWSWAGEWGPKDVALDRLLRPLMRQFASYRSRADLVLADGDRVVVHARATATTVRGDDYPQTYCFTLRMRDGRISEIVEHCDTALAERVLEPPPNLANGTAGLVDHLPAAVASRPRAAWSRVRRAPGPGAAAGPRPSG